MNQTFLILSSNTRSSHPCIRSHFLVQIQGERRIRNGKSLQCCGRKQEEEGSGRQVQERGKDLFFFLSELQSEKGLHLRNNPLEHRNRFMIHVDCHVTLEGRHAKKKPSVVRDTNPFLSGHQWCILLFLDWHQWKNTAYRKHCPFTNMLMPPFPPDGL